MMQAVVGPDMEDSSDYSEDDSTDVKRYEATVDFYYLKGRNGSDKVEFLDESLFTEEKQLWTDIASQFM